MSPDDVIRLRHMAEAAESAVRFVKGRARADVDTDDMLRFALTRAVEIIGEAANKVSIEARAQVPWHCLARYRWHAQPPGARVL
jgi:uncharacterized protein with HEPN domain